MTIDEAIKELTKHLGHKYSTPGTPFHNALKLGTEALIQIKEHRESAEHPWYLLLPGETEE